MIYREFGNTSFKTSCIGMGTYYDMRWVFKTYLGIYSGKEQKEDAIKSGIDSGINLIDTAELYRTEKIIASAIKGHRRGLIQSIQRRNKIKILIAGFIFYLCMESCN